MKSNEITTIREQVMAALARITVDTPVKIPPGRRASNYVYHHGMRTARRYSIRKGIVYLVPNKITYPPGYFSVRFDKVMPTHTHVSRAYTIK